MSMNGREGGGLEDLPMQPMGVEMSPQRGGGASRYFDRIMRRMMGDANGEDQIRVAWLSGTLFFIVGGYWLLRSIKDPIMTAIDGVEYIPQAKMLSLVVVFGCVVVYNKLLDYYPKHTLFYMMGVFYGILFGAIGLLLMHPTIGLPNQQADPSRILGWISYVSIESFGSMVVQCFWALVNATVDANFGKKNFGIIVAGAQIGAIMGPALATQAETVGIPFLYLVGAIVMFSMVAAMYFYVKRFGGVKEDEAPSKEEETSAQAKAKKDGAGIMGGFVLLMEHDYAKGLFAVSSLYMVQLTVIDYQLKVLARERFFSMHPGDTAAALKGFAAFMGMFGILTNSISFVFSLLGTGKFIQTFGLTISLLAFPSIMLVATAVLFVTPDIWTTLGVMMLMKAMGYALNNPAKEILYQATSTDIKFKCKSWIDTFGQRSAKAAGSIVTNACAESMADLVNYGTMVGIVMSTFLIWVAKYMGRTFDKLQQSGMKVGDGSTAEDLEAVPTDEKGSRGEDFDSDKSSSRRRLVSGDDDEESGDV